MATAAALVDVGTAAPRNSGGPGVVSVRLLGFANSTGRCSCGWLGRRRRLRAAAAQDAWSHAALDGCVVSSPLVFPG